MVEELVNAIDRARLVETCAAIVDVPAPTGYERPCAERLVSLLDDVGLTGELVGGDDRAASVICLIPATGRAAGTGPSILLYSPIDTVTTGDPGDDVPQAADVITGHLLPRGVVSADGSMVSGLGAQNPKGHAASILEAAAVLGAAPELAGEVIVAFGAGGMPTFALDGDDRPDTGHGVGVAAILDRLSALGRPPDAAIVAKTGWFVQHEEVGLAWIDVVVRGTHTYVGARHRLPYRNAIADGARVVLALEEAFADGAPPVEGRAVDSRAAAASLAPQAMVGSFHGGWARMAAFTPASVSIRADVRLLPGETGSDARQRIETVLDGLRAEDPGLDATTGVAVDIPASRTDADHWICRAGRAAWEEMEGRPHRSPADQSGSTDANIIRNRGIPTIRIGLPKVHIDGAELGFAEGMNTVDAAAMAALTEHLVRTVLNGHRTEAGQNADRTEATSVQTTWTPKEATT